MASMIRSDLEFVLQQILIAEAHAAGADLSTMVPNTFVPFGLRTVDGTYNNLLPGQSEFGASDNPFLRMVEAVYNPVYAAPGDVTDASPRVISNLIADMTTENPAAVAAFVNAGLGTFVGGVLHYLDGDVVGAVVPPSTLLQIPNTAPDAGLSAPFNSWFTFFGQFFDHGLDLVNKSATETIFIPLQADDPLYRASSPGTNFMAVSRTVAVNGEQTNQTTPFVDQNQTYTSHASHQVFLREYVMTPGPNGHPIATGKLLDGVDGGLTTWADVKAQALMLGIKLNDYDVLNVPELRTDAYGKFIPDANGFAQVIIGAGTDGLVNTADDLVVSGTASSPIDTLLVNALRTGHAFLNDIAHDANPVSSQDGHLLLADGDSTLGLSAPGTYDDELLARHFITGDGRGNENIALTAVHHVFHSEHNRQVDEIKATILASNDTAFISQWLLPGSNQADGVQALEWNGERLFQSARFATEMQYQHLVFEEFARKMSPNIDLFLADTNYGTDINPAIVAEFAHAVFRVGHTMLTETVDRLDPNFVANDVSLLDAFLNPLEFNENGTLAPKVAAGAIVRGMTRQEGNEIDEFVTDAVRNSLLGLPLDLAAINIARGRDTGIPTLNAARREFFDMTADQQLKPYTSWVDLTQHLKHEESVVNFIAAYGTHSALTAIDVDTIDEKRAVAAALVLGGSAVINAGGVGGPERTFVADNNDRLNFLNSTGSYANTAAGVTTTGVDAIDLWIGGLAEKQMPFGGLLGSTFNFVFETQLENLQNGDRLYYLSRLAGLNFLTEMENNTFAKLVMANTDATHLPADIFSAPGFILEVDPTKQFTGLGADNRADPTEGGSALVPIVIRDNPDTAGPDTNYLRYTGNEHVVLGGTAGNDIIIANIGDDTIYGDAGNDRIEAGDGNDQVEGGDGDDIITDRGGDDVLKGNDGNDVIHGGNGFNTIIGGNGKDFIITGEDVSTVFAGQGDDFVLGSKGNLPTFGNEGHDWIELGTQDGTTGDSFDPLNQDNIIGNDVLISGGGFDELIGEGGDDIFSGSDGEDHFDGGSGFDWAIYKFDKYGVTADMIVNDFIELGITPSTAGILDRFAFTEGLSGSAFSDFLRGDDQDATLIAQAGFHGSVLTNIDLITGLRDILPEGTTSFGSGNIILGGDGSDLIEGRGGNDIIDGDAWLNVRIAVSNHVPRIAGATPITSVDSIKDLVPYMLSGEINPTQLSIVREILHSDSTDFDTAMFAGPRANYTVTTGTDGVTTVTDNVGLDGTDTLRNIERLQFGDQAIVLSGTNNGPTGTLTLSDTTPQVNQLISVSAFGFTTNTTADDIVDADNVSATNPSGNLAGRAVAYIWQWEPDPVNGAGIFQDIVGAGGDLPATQAGPSFRVTPDLAGFALRVRAVYEDAHGVMENVFSAPTAAVAAGAPLAPPAALPDESLVGSPGVRFIRSDLQFILEQIQIAERHAAGEDLHDLLPNSRVAFGLRTVDGSFNNLVQGQTEFGAADNLFPRLLDPAYRNDLDGDSIVIGPGAPLTNTNYASNGNVVDADPRTISNLIVDQTDHNPATAGLGTSITSPGLDGLFGTADDTQVNFIPNTAADEGLSAPFNAFMTFFGQFFDHGLDLVTKGGNGTVFVPLQPDDPLYVPGGNANFLVLTRATQFAGPGADGILVDNPATAVNEAADNTIESQNTTTPFVDQNQTYTSHPSHQVFLRAYELDAQGHPVSTGKLITNRDLGADGKFGTGDDTEIGGMATWGVVKAQARDLLGIALTDLDVLNLPLLRTDAYGKFIPAANGFAQVITGAGADGIFNTADDLVVVGNPAAPVDTFAVSAVRTGHAFLNDIAHAASPVNDRGQVLAPDAGNAIGGADATHYDNELLDAHYIAGDGRANENIGLTTVHHVFHSEHNRLVELTKDVALASNDVDFLNQWLLTPVAALPADQAGIDALDWNGERLFQAARFGTEMQYQHLVFEEFARKVQPQVDIFFAATQVYDTEIDPSIVAEFAHTVYRFGHSMLTETVDRFDADFNVVGDSNATEAGNQQLGLIAAFLNPLEFVASGPTPDEAAGAITRGLTRQPGNQIDEFVTEALRNNLLGLPLDLATINLLRGRDTGVPSLNAARRDFYEGTGDSQLKPYSSWVDLLPHLKHEASLINFIAAYGTHASILAATSVADKRLAATNLVLGDSTLTGQDAIDFNSDRLAFLNSTGNYANSSTGVTTTGVDDIDFWIGGLAEKNMPFGGMLGTTFNFVFEEQMEKLQDGDRFYYLERTQGLNFLTELENNSFARLVMANTDATHLPMDVFSTPAFTLEVDPSKQFTGLGPDGRDDPAGVVLRSNPDDPGDPNYLHYTGPDHVVLGGSALNDTLVASEGDDTVYGDAGNDRLEGGDGNDFVIGGPGDDIMTDWGGDDNMQGGDGNDAIHGGNGVNLILGGFGSDFIVTGEDASEAFGGPGNDFILGGRTNEFVFGNEGDDWIEWGMADGSAGENFDAFNRDLALGNDVFIGNTISDRMDGEGGDDIMVGNGGNLDRYEGFSGFDWAVFKDDKYGVNADFELRAFDGTPVPLSNATVLARFVSMEGLSGSQFADVLRGDAFAADAIAVSGARGSVLTNIGLIDGLQELLDRALDPAAGTHVTSFGAGNIILGGGGSDIIEGRGGDDIIDGDAWLDVWMRAPDGNGGFVRADSMTELMGRVFAGDLNPGDISIVREIHAGSSTDFDTAVFTDVAANYDFTETNAAGDVIVRHLVAGGDGTDVLRNIERLQFADQAFILNGSDDPPTGSLTISDMTPTEDQVLTASALFVTDADNISATNPTGTIAPNAIAYFWQVEVSPGIFEDIIIENIGGEVARASGPTFTPRGFEVGSALRVRAVYKDDLGVLENVFSDPTAPVESNNVLPVGVLRISDITPTETFAVQAIIEFTDADGLPVDPAAFHFQWQQSTTLGGGAVFANIAGATAASFTPTQDQVNRQLRVIVTYTDLQGHPESVTSAPTVVTGDFINGLAAGEPLTGNAGQDVIFGNGGNDIINGNAEDDLLDGGAGADTINGGTGDDTILGGAGGDTLNGDAGNDVITGGDGGDTVSGGAGDDRFVATAGDGNDSYNGNAGTDTYDLSGILAAAGGVTVTATGATGGGTGNDTLNNIENVIGSQGNDNITLDAGVNVVDGQGGNDTISTGAAADTVNGGAGNDTINGGTGADVLNGNAGDDTFTYNIGDGNDIVDGGDGSDRVNILGAGGAQTLAVLLAGSAISTFAGASASNVESFAANLGAGNDLLSYGATTTGVNVNLVAGTATGFTSITNIEDVTGGAGNDTLIGGAGANVLTGGAGDDTLTGGAGGDTLAGGAGNDTLVATQGDGNDSYAGGAGTDDTYDASAITVALTVNLAAGTSSSTQTGTDTLATIEHVIGGSGNDTLTGSNAANTLEGRDGNDTINAGGGADLIDGGAGNDILNGEAGQDIITGGLGTDTVDGGTGADTFVATQGDGNDSYTGGTGADTYTLAGTSAGVVINVSTAAATGTAVGAATGTDTLAAIENFIGSQGNDTINVDVGANVVDGQDGDDIINTGAGADRLTGGLGNDTMNGGAGNDVFVFGTGFGQDTIVGFGANAQDRMDLQALGITALDFASRVHIEDLGVNTLVTIDDVNTITLLGVTGDTTNVITSADFILTP